MKTLVISLRFIVVFTVVLGLGYPLLVTGLGQLAFPAQANGSLVVSGGKVVGSTLIGQDFSKSALYFQGRLSAAGDHPYNPLASGGSNLTVVGKPFQDGVTAAVKVWQDKQKAAGVKGPIPEALVTASGSGLDPHLSLDAALFQVPFVALARPGSDPQKIKDLVESLASRPSLPWDPPAFVNVLALNQALDREFPVTK
jgi:K+-transporting ATPase ATPase C chain